MMHSKQGFEDHSVMVSIGLGLDMRESLACIKYKSIVDFFLFVPTSL
jgi:hypothetical protein